MKRRGFLGLLMAPLFAPLLKLVEAPVERGLLAGLDDDEYPQYLYVTGKDLHGRPTGQIICGGTGNSNMALASTSDATKGKICLGDSAYSTVSVNGVTKYIRFWDVTGT